MKRPTAIKTAAAVILLLVLLFLSLKNIFDKQRGVDEIGLGILTGIEGYDGTQASFLDHFFPDALETGLALADELKLPDINDPMAWQANYSIVGGSFGEGFLCTQYGLLTLNEIDAQAKNGTPTVWRDTLLREGQSQGYTAKLNCEFRFLNLRYRDSDRDAFLSDLNSAFSEVRVTSELKGLGDVQYTQYVIHASAQLDENSPVTSRVRLVINDLGNDADNLRGRLIILVRAPLNQP